MIRETLFPHWIAQDRVSCTPTQMTARVKWMLSSVPRHAVRQLIADLKDRQHAEELRARLNAAKDARDDAQA